MRDEFVFIHDQFEAHFVLIHADTSMHPYTLLSHSSIQIHDEQYAMGTVNGPFKHIRLLGAGWQRPGAV